MKILISGGSKSGKSHMAQSITKSLACGETMYYWATMDPVDDEDRLRIEKHIEDRAGWGFETVECGRNLASCLPLRNNASVLFDSVTALLTNEMFPNTGSGTAFDADAAARTLDEIKLAASSVKNFICVSDDIFRDGTVFDKTTETYRRALGEICRALAADFDVVIEASCGVVKQHKGMPLEVFYSLKEE